MPAIPSDDNRRYTDCLEKSRRVCWDIDRDVLRGREFDMDHKFLPDALSKVDELTMLSDGQQRLLSQIQGRTYANMFGLVERFINSKILEVGGAPGRDAAACAALARFSEEELKHQELFRRIERMIASRMPDGYRFLPQPDEVAALVLGKSTWAVLALTCMIELFTLAHYRQSIAPDDRLSGLYRDVFLYHWKEESQHVILDELEWTREDAKRNASERDQAVDELIELVDAIDRLLQLQAGADADYFLQLREHQFTDIVASHVRDCLVRAYRWQYIASGIEQPRFQAILCNLINREQSRRLGSALAPIVGGGGAHLVAQPGTIGDRTNDCVVRPALS